MGIVTTDDDTDPGIGVRITNAHGEIVERFSPGMFAYARGGKEIKFNNPAVVAGYADYKKAMLRTIAAGYRIPYELLTGDLSDVELFEHPRWHHRVPQVYSILPVADRYSDVPAARVGLVLRGCVFGWQA